MQIGDQIAKLLTLAERRDHGANHLSRAAAHLGVLDFHLDQIEQLAQSPDKVHARAQHLLGGALALGKAHAEVKSAVRHAGRLASHDDRFGPADARAQSASNACEQLSDDLCQVAKYAAIPSRKPDDAAILTHSALGKARDHRAAATDAIEKARAHLA